MVEPVVTPTEIYTGNEACPKCAATGYAYIACGYDAELNYIQLQCKKCTHKWHVLPVDSLP